FHRWSSQELPAKLAEAGFNTIHVQFCNGCGDFDKWAQLARENGLRFIASTWWSYPAHRQQQHGTDCGIGTRYRGFVNAAGRVHTRTVCPLDERYWNDWIMPMFLELAKLGKEHGLDGITLDTELYGSAEPDGSMSGHYYFAGVCLCDHCFGDFLASIEAEETPADIPREQRYAWLQKHSQVEAYEARLKDNVEALARQMEQQVHAIDANLLLGFLNYYGAGDFFLNGLRDGLRTAQRPVMIWTETPTYKMGYGPHVDEQYKRFNAIGDVIYIPGLWLEAHAPRSLPRQVHDLAMHSDGYWIYTHHQDLLAHPYILDLFRGGNSNIANAAPASDEAPFADLWGNYAPVLSLPETWQFRLDPEDVGREEEWFKADLDETDWQSINIGEFWGKQIGTEYEGIGWYRVSLHVPAEASGKKLFLAFGAVDEEAWIWVNGQPVGEHAEGPQGWDQRFLIEVTEQLKPGHKNLIAVRVFNTRAAGGIWKPVRLITQK
ncbi:MAG: beta galactosidase jelly roll domain-containing protein, partial [Armatimonadetes bacterium]|nr:beta galactosidase jelly roll domain-containing protein [Armatimonadota bacterium]